MVLTRDAGDAAAAKRRDLAAELRVLRNANGITGREMARRTGISQSKVVRIEAGLALPSIAQVTAWTQAAGATSETKALLAKLTDAARAGVEAWHDTLQGRTHAAGGAKTAGVRLTRSFEPAMIPGLLQTPDYAQRVLMMHRELAPEIDVPARAAERINGQRILYEEGKEFAFVIVESALRWRPGPPRLLIPQLAHLAALSTKGNVRIGIISLLGVEARAAWGLPFTIYDPDEGFASLVRVATTHAALSLEAAGEVALYEAHWAALQQAARFGEDAREFLTELIAVVRATVQDHRAVTAGANR